MARSRRSVARTGVSRSVDDDVAFRVYELVVGVLTRHRATAEATLVKALRNPRLTIALLELAGKLTRELGPHVDGAQLVAIEIQTRLPVDTMMQEARGLDARASALNTATEDDHHEPDEPDGRQRAIALDRGQGPPSE
jgi:hypothetical protein